MIERDISADEARKEVVDKLAKKDSENETRSATIEAGGQDADDTRRAGMEAALLHRTNPKRYKMTDEGRQYAYRSLMYLGEECLRARNVSMLGKTPSEIADRSLHSSSDFPLILANVAGKTLRDEYELALRTFEPFTRPMTTPDFKEIQRTQLSDAPALELLGEHGEVKGGKMSEAAEKYSLATYAKKIGITRKVIINDDLSAMGRIPAAMGRAARDLENDLVYAHLEANGNMGDGNPLFDATHSNLGTPAVPSETTLQEMRQSMRKQLSLQLKKLNLFPVFLLVPAELETTAEKLVAAIQPQDTSKVNPFGPGGRTPLSLIVEPRLTSATAYYGFARLEAIDIMEIVRLEGSEAPIVSTRDGFDVEGMEIKVVHDVAVKAIDWRGMFKNAGA
jgi:hypothetical protein